MLFALILHQENVVESCCRFERFTLTKSLAVLRNLLYSHNCFGIISAFRASSCFISFSCLIETRIEENKLEKRFALLSACFVRFCQKC